MATGQQPIVPIEGESTNVLETMESLADGDFPGMFVNKFIPIMEHSKDEVLELLKQRSLDLLKCLRELAFSELVMKLPQYAGREMYARKKDELVAEDIYVFSFAAINGRPVK